MASEPRAALDVLDGGTMVRQYAQHMRQQHAQIWRQMTWHLVSARDDVGAQPSRTVVLEWQAFGDQRKENHA